RQDLRLHLEQVLAGLEDQEIRPALDQPLGLLEERGDQVLEAQASEVGILRGGQHPGGPDRAGDEPGPSIRRLEAVRHPPGDRAPSSHSSGRSFEAWKELVSTTSAPASK